MPFQSVLRGAGIPPDGAKCQEVLGEFLTRYSEGQTTARSCVPTKLGHYRPIHLSVCPEQLFSALSATNYLASFAKQ
ncbi:MAG TPA: hypothetical protein PK156_10660 [Polyangium sp.]|nr:hypothetical protein [Polyangium sp.]